MPDEQRIVRWRLSPAGVGRPRPAPASLAASVRVETPSPSPTSATAFPASGSNIIPGRNVARRPARTSPSNGNWIAGDLIVTMPSGWTQESPERGSGMRRAARIWISA